MRLPSSSDSVLLSAVLVAATLPLGAQEPLRPAALFDLTAAELRAVDPATSLQARLVLADALQGEDGPEQAARLLDDSANAAQLALDQPWKHYLSGIRCAQRIREGSIDRAEPLCTSALEGVQTIDSAFVRARIHYFESFRQVRLGHLEAAYPQTQMSMEAARHSGSSMALAAALNANGLILMASGNHDRALQRFERVRQLTEASPDRAMADILNFNLGIAHLEAGDVERAREAFRAGTAWAEQTGQAHRVLIGRTQLARADLAAGDVEAARKGLAPLLADATIRHDPDSLAHALLIYARTHLETGEPEAAMTYLTRGLEAIGDSENLVRSVQLRLAQVEALDTLNRHRDAQTLAQSVVDSLEGRESEHLDDALRALARAAAARGDYELAFRSMTRAERAAADAAREKLGLQAAVVRDSHNVQRARHEADVARAEASRLRAVAQRNTLLLAGLVAVLGLLVVTLALNRARREQRVIAQQKTRLSEELEGLVQVRTEALEIEMTERMRGEQQRHELEKQLAEADKLRALGQLTGGIAHDFNNLLTVVTSASEMLALEPDMSEGERQELISAIQRSADSGRDVNKGLLAYARQQPLKPETIDLQEHVLSSRRIFERTLGEGMTLHIQCESSSIQVDRGQLTTALINLLINARDASERRGEVFIDVRQTRRAGEERVVVEVRDQGCGMSPDQLERAVEPFYSTKTSTLSTGLGLSMVYGFVHQSGGTLDLESNEGRGTTVRLEFPHARTGAVEAASGPAPTQLPRGLQVLLVDDNADVRNMMELMLRSLGQQVRVAGGGVEALEMIEAEPPDVLVSDVLMPGALNGLELAGAARERVPELPILMVSGFAQAIEIEYPLLSKPFSKEDLARELERVLSTDQSRGRATA